MKTCFVCIFIINNFILGAAISNDIITELREQAKEICKYFAKLTQTLDNGFEKVARGNQCAFSSMKPKEEPITVKTESVPPPADEESSLDFSNIPIVIENYDGDNAVEVPVEGAPVDQNQRELSSESSSDGYADNQVGGRFDSDSSFEEDLKGPNHF